MNNTEIDANNNNIDEDELDFEYKNEERKLLLHDGSDSSKSENKKKLQIFNEEEEEEKNDNLSHSPLKVIQLQEKSFSTVIENKKKDLFEDEEDDGILTGRDGSVVKSIVIDKSNNVINNVFNNGELEEDEDL